MAALSRLHRSERQRGNDGILSLAAMAKGTVDSARVWRDHLSRRRSLRGARTLRVTEGVRAAVTQMDGVQHLTCISGGGHPYPLPLLV